LWTWWLRWLRSGFVPDATGFAHIIRSGADVVFWVHDSPVRTRLSLTLRARGII
jgi:hypothetical protein